MASGYGSLMDEENQQPQSQQASGYGALMDDEATQSKAAIAQSVSMAVDADPDRKAKVLELSQKTNMPPELVERNFDELNKQHTVESMNYAELMDKNPGLSESLKDQNFAAVAKDDIDALKKLEKSTHEYSFLSKAYDSLNYGLDQMYTDAAKIPALIYDIGAAPQNLFMKAIGKPERQVSAPDWLRNNPIAKFYERGKDAFHVDEMDQSITEKLTNIKSAKDLADAGKTFAIQFMANAPQQALLLASYAAGLGEAGLVQTGLSTAAGSAAESAQEGKDPLSSTVAAVTKGTIESAFESLGTFGMLKSMEGKIARQVGKDASQTIMKDFFQTMLYSVASEGNEEFWTSVAQDYTDYVTGNNPDALKGILTRASDAFVLGGASGGLMTGPTGAAVASHRAHKVRQAQLASDFYKSLGESAGESKLRERLPEAHKNYVEKLTKGGPIENIFIPVDAVTAYMQSGKGGANVLGELGIAKQYDQAKETGQDIQVPLANWIDATTKSDRFMDFANDVKFSENESTVNQEKQISAELKAEADKVAAEQKTKIETESAEVKKSVIDQLVATGKYNQADANTAAELWGNFFRTASENSSVATVPGFGQVTPKQLYDKYIGKIQAGEAPTAEDAVGLNQSAINKTDTSEFKNWFGQSKAVDGGGKPLIVYHGTPRSFDEFSPTHSLTAGIAGFFSTNRDMAKSFATGAQGNIIETYLSVKNPFDPKSDFEMAEDFYDINGAEGFFSKEGFVNAVKNGSWEAIESQGFIDYLQEQGKDAIITHEDGNVNYGVFSPTQVKSVDNSGTFDPKNPNIFFQSKKQTRVDSIKNEIEQSTGQPLGIELYEGDYYRENSTGYDDPNISGARLKRADKAGFDTQNSWFHGSRGQFDSFSKETLGESTGAGSARLAHFFTASPDLAGDYATASDSTLFLRSKRSEAEATKEMDVFKKEMADKYGSKWTAKLSDAEKARRQSINKMLKQSVDDFNLAHEASKKYTIPNLQDDIKHAEQNIKSMERDLKEKSYKKKNKDVKNYLEYNKKLLDNTDWVPAPDGRGMNVIDRSTGERIANDVFKNESGDTKYRFYNTKENIQRVVEKLANRLNENTPENLQKSIDEAKQTLAEMKNNLTKLNQGVDGESVYKVVLKMKDPLIADFKGAEYREVTYREILEKAKASGYDGVIFKNTYDPAIIGFGAPDAQLTDIAAVFEANQIRSVNAKFSDLKSDLLFNQPGPDEPRGSATFDKNRNVIINLFKTADLSTFLHESGHVFLEIMGDLAQADGAPTKVKDDYSSLLKWLGVESRDQIKTEHHEQLARGFEAYLMEGKAPTQALRSAFAQIKTWLLAIYKSAKKLDVELNDDIRNVFDRWLATEEEIEAANRDVNFEPLFKDPAGFGMTGPQAERYQKAIDDSRMAAEEQLAARLIADFERRKTAQYKERFKIIAGEIETQANEMNVYKLLYALQKNTKPDGSPLPDGMPTQIKIDREAATKEFGYDPKRLPTRILSTIKDGGFHPSQLAEMFGFENGDALLRELANSVPKKDYIEREANNRIKQEFPDIYEDGKIHDEAVKYIHNNMKSKLMLMELEHMATNHLPAMKDVIKKIARRVPTEKAVREQAVKIIADRKITDIRPHLFLRAEAKAAKESGILFTKGDFEGAFNAKRRELLNHELYRAAIEAQEDIDKSQDKFKRLFKPDEKIAKSRDMDYVNAARAILAQYGLAKTDKTAAQYIKPIMDYDPDTYQAVAAIIDSATQNAGPWEQIKYDDYVAVKDAVISLWALAKTSKEIEIDGKRESRDEAMAFLTARIAELSKTDQKAEYTRSKTKWEKSKLMLMGTRSALRRVESWIDSMDGTAGKMFRKYIWNPVKESETNYKIAKLPLIKKFLEIVKPIEQTLVKKEIIAHELLDNRGRKYVFRSKAELLGAILHTGNDSNLSKLLRGYGWGQFNDDGSLDRRRWDSFVKRMWDEGVLTKADYDVMQATWDLMESIKPEAQKAHKKMYGHYFSEVTANEIVTPWGVYRGGYVPAKVDPNNPQASARQDKENLEKNGNSYAFPTTGRGATKTRVEAYAAPLMMDLNLIPAHIDWAMRFIHIEPAIKDVSKILLNREFQSRLNEFDQTAMSDMLVPWLQRTGQQKVSMPSQGQAGRMLDTVSKFLRRNSGMAIMFGNVLNTAQQFTGVLPATIKVKQRFLRNALWALTRSPAKTAEMINEKSKFMQTRSGNQLLDVQKDINDLLLNPSKYERFTDFTQKHAYFMQGFTQGVVDSVVWVGAYDQAVENGLDEKEAVREADSAVRLTQGSFDASDVSRYSTGSPFQRLFTMFFDYFNMLGNLMGTEYATTMREMGLKKGAGRMLYVYVFAFMGTAVISEAIMKLGGGKLDEDDDDEYMDDFISMFFGSQFRTLTAMLPGGSAVTNYVSNKFSDKRVFDDRISLSPSIKMIEQTVNAPFSIYEAIANDGSEKKAVRDVLTAVSLLSGIPVAPLARPIGYQIDVNEGNASPSGPIDYTRGLVTGRSSQ